MPALAPIGFASPFAAGAVPGTGLPWVIFDVASLPEIRGELGELGELVSGHIYMRSYMYVLCNVCVCPSHLVLG